MDGLNVSRNCPTVAFTTAAAPSVRVGKDLCAKTNSFNAPPSVQIIPLLPHSSRVTFLSTGLIVIGTLFHELYEAINARDPPSVIPLKKGNE